MDVLGSALAGSADRSGAIGLFRRKNRKKDDDGEVPMFIDPLEDAGMIGLHYRVLAEVDRDFVRATKEHLARIHEPGGYEREKQAYDFVESGMTRDYLQALEDVVLAIDDDVLVVPITAVRRRGTATIVTRWTARGVHNRPLLGFPPSGEELTVEGLTYTTFRNYNIRVSYSYWHVPELTRRMVER